MVVLSLDGISKRFGRTVALEGVGLELRRGQIHALVGENGAGKSTLMEILAGSLKPDRGQMLLNGAPYVPLSPREARGSGISLVHQEPLLCPHLTVAENILIGAESVRWGWLDYAAEKKRVEQVLTLFSHPEIRPDRKVGDLSLSARQILEICRALSIPARIILMDEPTSALQKDDVDRLFALIRGLADEGKSVIYISHFLEEVREVADYCTVLRDGKNVCSGPLAEMTDDELIARMVGRPVENLYPRLAATRQGQTVLRVRGLTAPPAVRRADFELRQGEVLGIAGLAGSGRTELVRALFGLDPPASGTIEIHSRAVEARTFRPKIQIQRGVGYLSEDRKGEGLALSLSLADNITLTGFSSCATQGWIRLSQQESQARERARQLKIKARSVQQPVSSLSGGNQQKVAFARLLHQDADIFLLDEPTRGIDIGSKAQIYAVIARLVAQKKAVLLVSSYLPEVFGLCHRLAVMSRGTLSPTRPINEWTPESVLKVALGKATGRAKGEVRSEKGGGERGPG